MAETITKGYQWRDGSGTYACPSCEDKPSKRDDSNLARLKPGQTNCPKCNVDLVWRLDLDRTKNE